VELVFSFMFLQVSVRYGIENMTLLSNAFVATPSTAADTISIKNDSRSVPYSPSPDGPTPSQVLAMTIKKKRRVLRSKDRNLRVEILLTSTIRRLCQEIGDHLRTRRMGGAKRKSTMESESESESEQEDGSSTATVRQHAVKRSRFVAEDRDDEIVRKQELSMMTKRTIPFRRTIPSRTPRTLSLMVS